MKNPQLFSRIFNCPLMIQPSKLDAVIAGIGGRFGLEQIPAEAYVTAQGEAKAPQFQVIGSTAVIDVFGILTHRGQVQGLSSYCLGYDSYARAINAALADPKVNSILLQIDSPGGEVAGAFELAAAIKEAGKTKPVKAVISSMAASAAYLLASAASEVAIAETGTAGSIGVVMRHIDMSKAAEKDGISVTYIYAGGHKVDGNPFEPLPKAVKADLQSQINNLYDLFVKTVANNRNLSEQAVIGQQAKVYTGQDAIAAGLADRIATPDEVLRELTGNNGKAKAGMVSEDKGDWAKAFAPYQKPASTTAMENPPKPANLAGLPIVRNSAQSAEGAARDQAAQPSLTDGGHAKQQEGDKYGWQALAQKANQKPTKQRS